MSERFQIVPVTDSIFLSIDARGCFSCAKVSVNWILKRVKTDLIDTGFDG